jgi:hypothetical protein
MVCPRVVAVAHPGRVEAAAPTAGLGAGARGGVVVRVLVLAAAAQRPRSLGHDVVEPSTLAAARLAPTAKVPGAAGVAASRRLREGGGRGDTDLQACSGACSLCRWPQRQRLSVRIANWAHSLWHTCAGVGGALGLCVRVWVSSRGPGRPDHHSLPGTPTRYASWKWFR